MRTKIVFNSWLGRIVGKLGYAAITVGWFIFPAQGEKTVGMKLLNHEGIHVRQQAEMFFLLHWLWYAVEYVVRLAQYRSHDKAYYNISFEREAYANEADFGYLQARKRWAWTKYL
jgi:hypothetical protein